MHRKFRETVKTQFDEPHLMTYLSLLRDTMWENGQLKPNGPPRTAEEKLRTRDDVNRKLSALIPGELQIACLPEWPRPDHHFQIWEQT